ncbi:hypothetical protein EVAR_21967_1 [Eumeta japonica]|uniref:Uncharacterized protein n=1 Tax=Eumeta variegata TaxID=151549 RepID=A0A4C1VWG0_EUMVA|nr:hypothetical protein EVAR_21967_1 [Eumeta japonica]
MKDTYRYASPSPDSRARETPEGFEVDIKMQDEVPVHKPSYILFVGQREIIGQQVQQMLDNGVIIYSKNPYESPVILVKKPNDTLRNPLKESNEVKTVDEEIELPVYRISTETLIERQRDDEFCKHAVEWRNGGRSDLDPELPRRPSAGGERQRPPSPIRLPRPGPTA